MSDLLNPCSFSKLFKYMLEISEDKDGDARLSLINDYSQSQNNQDSPDIGELVGSICHLLECLSLPHSLANCTIFEVHTTGTDKR